MLSREMTTHKVEMIINSSPLPQKDFGSEKFFFIGWTMMMKFFLTYGFFFGQRFPIFGNNHWYIPEQNNLIIVIFFTSVCFFFFFFDRNRLWCQKHSENPSQGKSQRLTPYYIYIYIYICDAFQQNDKHKVDMIINPPKKVSVPKRVFLLWMTWRWKLEWWRWV